MPWLTSSTSIVRGGGMTANATLSVSRSSDTSRRARRTPPPRSENGTTTARRTSGSSVRVFSASVSSSRVSVSEKVCGVAEKFATERKAWELYVPK